MFFRANQYILRSIFFWIYLGGRLTVNLKATLIKLWFVVLFNHMTLTLYEYHWLLLSDVSLGLESYFVLKFWLAKQ